jgi:DNA-binding transcriptional regulator YhcF (GntR family)
MRELVVSTTDPTPPYEQLRRQLADLIESGSLAIGDRLPPLRQLAGDLGLAVGTVARTYRELESAGLIVSRRGGGTRVAGRPAQREHTDALRRAAEAYIREGKRLGARREDMIATLRAAFTVAD